MKWPSPRMNKFHIQQVKDFIGQAGQAGLTGSVFLKVFVLCKQL
jgi:hypothetical protein